jgi:acyl-CoA synthetase (AMP-forming)/AMP-acid ligase II
VASSEELIASRPHHDVEPPSVESRFTMLTSGTTGTPKGAKRGSPKGMLPIASMLSRLPLRSGERTMIAAPLFHSWGLGQFQLGLILGSTYVMTRRFDAEETLRTAPGTAGRPPLGTTVKILDGDGRPLPPGRTGRIFVANAISFEGYTSGDDKERVGSMVSSGDVGHFDEEGRLFVDGRDDDMIISGGENVFPREVEDLISGHECVEEAAVVGVSDLEWGQRLEAFVVLKPGVSLSEADVKAHVKHNLAGHKVPRKVWFLDSLPRNATGKVLHRELVK